jgi:hypothetical protein
MIEPRPDGRTLLIIVTSGPESPRRCVTPFQVAVIGAIMEWDVSMYFTIGGARLLKKGVAETVQREHGGKTVGEWLHEAVELGVRMYVCTDSMELNDVALDDLLEGVELAGIATMLAMADEARIVLTI